MNVNNTNVAIGYNALMALTTGSANTAVGYDALTLHAPGARPNRCIQRPPSFE